jgi:hypothetical protein
MRNKVSSRDVIDDELRRMVSAAVSSADGVLALRNSAVIGRLREIVIQKLLGKLLPHTCRANTGMTVSSFGSKNHSLQDDVLVVDTECLPPVLSFESSGVFPIESVLSRIEVKSRLTSEELAKTIRDCRRYRRLKMTDAPVTDGSRSRPIDNDALLGLFAFRSQLADPWQLFCRLTNSSSAPRPLDFLCVVGKGFWHWGWSPSSNKERWRVCKSDGKYSEVLAFLALLLDRLPALRQRRHTTTFSRYVVCLRSDKMKDAKWPTAARAYKAVRT